jgi:hypothetical protein
LNNSYGKPEFKGKTGFFKVIRHEFNYIREYDENFRLMFEGEVKRDKYERHGEFFWGRVSVDASWKNGAVWGDCKVKVKGVLRFQGKAYGLSVGKIKDFNKGFAVLPEFRGEGRCYDPNGKMVYQGKFNHTVNVAEKFSNRGLKRTNQL